MSLDHDKIDRLNKDLLWEISRAHYWAVGGNNNDQCARHLQRALAFSEQLKDETSLEKIMGIKHEPAAAKA